MYDATAQSQESGSAVTDVSDGQGSGEQSEHGEDEGSY